MVYNYYLTMNPIPCVRLTNPKNPNGRDRHPILAQLEYEPPPGKKRHSKRPSSLPYAMQRPPKKIDPSQDGGKEQRLCTIEGLLLSPRSTMQNNRPCDTTSDGTKQPEGAFRGSTDDTMGEFQKSKGEQKLL